MQKKAKISTQTIEKISFVYFLGIGGIGMSAIARWFNTNGFVVIGYDKTETKLTQQLALEGIQVHYTDSLSNIPREVTNNVHKTLVVITPAIPKENEEWAFFRKNNYNILKRSEVLGLLSEEMFTIGVAGTHGKTTTSSMIAHVLKHSGKNISAFLGGITQNYQTNLVLNTPEPDMKKVCNVVEADEYDRSFLTLFPEIAVVTSTDADHLDIYGKHEQMIDSFKQYVSQIQKNGLLVMKAGLEIAQDTQARVVDYGINEGEVQATNIRIEGSNFVFDIKTKENKLEKLIIQLPGFHNVLNALATYIVCENIGLSEIEIRNGLETFRGVKRRFEYHIKTEKNILIDDYAHHPAEVEAFLTSVKAIYPNQKITAIFQPHLFSRTQDFAPEFAKSLSLADEVLLLDIYPARELPIEGVTSDIILKEITSPQKQIFGKNELLAYIKESKPNLLVTIGAGDIDKLLEPLTQLVTNS